MYSSKPGSPQHRANGENRENEKIFFLCMENTGNLIFNLNSGKTHEILFWWSNKNVK